MRLQDCCHIAGRIGFRGYTKDDLVSKDEGVITLSPSNIVDGAMDYSKCTYISWHKYDESPEIKVYEGDILLVKTGSSYGKCALVSHLPKEATINPQFVVIKNISINPEYLTCVLQSEYARRLYEGFVLGTAIPTFTQEKLGNMLLPLPPIGEQKGIVATINEFNLHISNIENKKEELSDSIALSKSKILEFAMQGKLVPQDPTDEPAADMLRRINPRARIITDNPHYPQLPDNWVWISIEDLNEYKPKSINPAESLSEIFDLYSVPIFPTGHPEKVIGKEIGSTKQSVQYGDVLLCKINPHLNRVWTIEEVSDNMQIASSEWIVIRSSSTYSTYLRWLFSSPFFRKLLCSQVSGVGGSLTRAQPATVKKYLIPIPPYNEQIRIVSKIVELLSALTDIDSNLAD